MATSPDSPSGEITRQVVVDVLADLHFLLVESVSRRLLINTPDLMLMSDLVTGLCEQRKRNFEGRLPGL